MLRSIVEGQLEALEDKARSLDPTYRAPTLADLHWIHYLAYLRLPRIDGADGRESADVASAASDGSLPSVFSMVDLTRVPQVDLSAGASESDSIHAHGEDALCVPLCNLDPWAVAERDLQARSENFVDLGGACTATAFQTCSSRALSKVTMPATAGWTWMRRS